MKPYEGQEFCQIFRSFFGPCSFKKKCFWDLLIGGYTIQIVHRHKPECSRIHNFRGMPVFWSLFSVIIKFIRSELKPTEELFVGGDGSCFWTAGSRTFWTDDSAFRIGSTFCSDLGASGASFCTSECNKLKKKRKL